jgi:hypothetical protein
MLRAFCLKKEETAQEDVLIWLFDKLEDFLLFEANGARIYKALQSREYVNSELIICACVKHFSRSTKNIFIGTDEAKFSEDTLKTNRLILGRLDQGCKSIFSFIIAPESVFVTELLPAAGTPEFQVNQFKIYFAN